MLLQAKAPAADILHNAEDCVELEQATAGTDQRGASPHGNAEHTSGCTAHCSHVQPARAGTDQPGPFLHGNAKGLPACTQDGLHPDPATAGRDQPGASPHGNAEHPPLSTEGGLHLQPATAGTDQHLASPQDDAAHLPARTDGPGQTGSDDQMVHAALPDAADAVKAKAATPCGDRPLPISAGCGNGAALVREELSTDDFWESLLDSAAEDAGEGDPHSMYRIIGIRIV